MPSADAQLFQTSAWQTLGKLMLRSDINGTQSLLLKHSEREVIYRYDPGIQSLSQVTEGVWQGATGPITDCQSQFPPSPLELDIEKSGQLHVAGRKIATAGSTVLSLLASPTSKKVAVLSAEGPKKEPIFPFLGGGGASGQRYHQIIHLPDATLLGDPVRLPAEFQKDDVINICWSPEEKYVVYTDIFFFHLSIVDVAADGD